MDTEKKYGLKKPKAILLFVQMLLTIIILVVALYLLVYVSINGLGAWMIASYIFISLSVLAIFGYGIIGYKEGELIYLLSIIPYLVAIFINIMLPNRNAFQVGLLSILFALTFAFAIKQKDFKFNQIISILMVVTSLTFSIYSSITARVDFLGNISENWLTYVAMYLSIFVPTIMSGTFALTYNVRNTKSSITK